MISPRKSETSIALQARDVALLQDLLDSRLMTIKHAAALHFNGKHEAAKKRLQKLQRAGLIVQRRRRPQEPAVYTLGRKGYLRLRQAGMLDPLTDPGWLKLQKRQAIGDLMLRHELAVMDAKVAFTGAIAAEARLEPLAISTSAQRHRFRVIQPVVSGGLVRFRSLLAKPDGFLHVRERRGDRSPIDHFFFLEVDRGTEALGRVVQKAKHYGQYYRKGGFAAKLGQRGEDYKRFPFRVLMAFLSAQRRDHVAELLLKAPRPIKSQVWLTTLPELSKAPLGPIWSKPEDYRHGPPATGSSLFNAPPAA